MERISSAKRIVPAEPHLGFGGALTLCGWHVLANRVYTRAAARNPGCSGAERRLGESLTRCKRWRLAAESYRKCLRLEGPNAEDLGALVLALWRSGQGRSALKSLEAMRCLDPSARELLLLKGALLTKVGDHAEAVRAYRLAACCAPLPDDLRFLLAEQLLGRERWEAAVRAARAAAELRTSRDPSRGRSASGEATRILASELATLRAGLFMRIGRRRSALRTLQAAVAASSPPPPARWRIGEGLLGRPGWQAAQAAYAAIAAAHERGRRTPTRAKRGDVTMPAPPPRPARHSSSPRPAFDSRLALIAASLCALALGFGLVAAARGSVAAASALDSPEARRLSERCTTLGGRPGIDACEGALALRLSPARASIVREALAHKRARSSSVPTRMGGAAGQGAGSARP